MSRYYVTFIDAAAVEQERQRLLAAGRSEEDLDSCADWWDPADYTVSVDVGDTLARARKRAKQIVADRAEYNCGTLCEIVPPEDGYGLPDSHDVEDIEG